MIAVAAPSVNLAVAVLVPGQSSWMGPGSDEEPPQGPNPLRHENSVPSALVQPAGKGCDGSDLGLECHRRDGRVAGHELLRLAAAGPAAARAINRVAARREGARIPGQRRLVAGAKAMEARRSRGAGIRALAILEAEAQRERLRLPHRRHGELVAERPFRDEVLVDDGLVLDHERYGLKRRRIAPLGKMPPSGLSSTLAPPPFPPSSCEPASALAAAVLAGGRPAPAVSGAMSPSLETLPPQAAMVASPASTTTKCLIVARGEQDACHASAFRNAAQTRTRECQSAPHAARPGAPPSR